jgi:hypothetical protein
MRTNFNWIGSSDELFDFSIEKFVLIYRVPYAHVLAHQ